MCGLSRIVASTDFPNCGFWVSLFQPVAASCCAPAIDTPEYIAAASGGRIASTGSCNDLTAARPTVASVSHRQWSTVDRTALPYHCDNCEHLGSTVGFADNQEWTWPRSER